MKKNCRRGDRSLGGHRNNDRLLMLREVLFHHTDEHHELNVYEIQEMLMQKLHVDNIDIRTIKNDIDALANMGFEVVKNRRKFGKIYYSHQMKLFETYQLRLLVDAILSARFITINEKMILIEKLQNMTSKYIADTLPGPIGFNQTANIDNNWVRQNIDRIHHAISNQKVIRYQYGSYDENKQFVFRRDGNFYEVAPYGLIWQNDFYYIIGYSLLDGEIRHYRLDRIRHISLTKQSYELDKSFDLQSYVAQTFHMYSGDDVEVTLKFEKSLLKAIFDEFGLDVQIIPDGSEHFRLYIRAKLSDGLISWLLKWGAKIEVITPESLRDELKREINKMKAIYDND